MADTLHDCFANFTTTGTPPGHDLIIHQVVKLSIQGFQTHIRGRTDRTRECLIFVFIFCHQGIDTVITKAGFTLSALHGVNHKWTRT